MGLDIDSCVSYTGSLDKDIFQVNDSSQTLLEFLKTHNRIVTVEHFSTKRIVDGDPVLSVFKDRYLEFFKTYMLVELEESQKVVGYLIQFLLRNPFPGYLEPGEVY